MHDVSNAVYMYILDNKITDMVRYIFSKPVVR